MIPERDELAHQGRIPLLASTADGDQTVPHVQVFIPSFNRLPKLKRAVQSVLSQKWPGVSVVVLDNHSTDGTLEWLQALDTNDSRVSYVRHPTNIGMIPNFNAIAGRVSSEYFSILADDDTYEPDFVATAMRHFNTDPGIDFVACNAQTMVGGEPVKRQLDYWREGRYNAGAAVLKCLFGHYPLITNCVFRRDLRHQFVFHPELGNTGDGFILTNLFANHASYVSKVVSGVWNNDGDNASTVAAFDAVGVARAAIAEYRLYRQLSHEGRFTRRWLVVAWFKRDLSILVAANKFGFDAVRHGAGLRESVGSVEEFVLRLAWRTGVIRAVTGFLQWARSVARRRVAVRETGAGRPPNERNGG